MGAAGKRGNGRVGGPSSAGKRSMTTTKKTTTKKTKKTTTTKKATTKATEKTTATKTKAAPAAAAAKKEKRKKGPSSQSVVPLPEGALSTSSDSSVDLDDEEFELLDEVDTGFLSRLPKAALDRAVSEAREKAKVPRHPEGHGGGVRGVGATSSPSSSDGDARGEGEGEGESEGDGEEAWERGPRGPGGRAGGFGEAGASAAASMRKRVRERVHQQQQQKEQQETTAATAAATSAPSLLRLPVKLPDGSMAFEKSNGLQAIHADAFEGVTVLDDGRASREEAMSAERAAARVAEAKREQEELRKAKEESRKAAQELVQEAAQEAQERQQRQEETYKDEALKPLLGCTTKAQRRENAKMVIAKASQSLLGDPNRQLRKQMPILLELVADGDVHIAKLSMLSIFAIMRDIVPAYKIRPQHEREKEDVVQSKDVKELWAHENALLKAYQSYLKVLLKAFKGQKERPKSKSALALGRAAATCLASLITALPHFNFSGDILQVIVPGIANKDAEIKAACAGAVSALVEDGLRSTESGQAAVEATQLLADFAKRRNCTGLPPEVVSCLMAFTFPDIVSAEDLAEAKRSRKSKKKKGKRKGKDERDVNRAFKEAQAVVDKDTRRHQQSVALEAMFEMYFRVLKTAEKDLKKDDVVVVDERGAERGLVANVPTQWSSTRFRKRFPLMAPTLQGLARFAHLISVDYFQDIISTLEDILDSPRVPHDIRCRCLLTASEIAKGQVASDDALAVEGHAPAPAPAHKHRGLSLNIDRAALYKELYKAMYATMEVPLEDDDHTTFPSLLTRATFHDGYPGASLVPPIPFEETPPVLLAKVLDDMLLDSRRALDVHRQAAFTKRAATIALQTTDSGLALTMLYVIYRMLKRYPKLRSMIEDDEGAGPSASYYGAILKNDKGKRARTRSRGNKKGKGSGLDPSSAANSTLSSVEFANEDPGAHEGALYTPLWELAILASAHANPGVRKAANFVSMMSVSAARAAATGETGEQVAALGSIFGAGLTSCADVCLHSSTGRGAFVPSVRVPSPKREKREKREKKRTNDSHPATEPKKRKRKHHEDGRWVGILCGSPLPFREIHVDDSDSDDEEARG